MHYSRSSWIEIDLESLFNNIKKLKKITGRKIIAVVKADAYGHGIEIAQYMEKKVSMFAVATVEEGINLRELGIKKPILLLGNLEISCLDEISNFDLTPTIASLHSIKTLRKYLETNGGMIATHLEIDTGMNRTGVKPSQLEKVFEQLQSSAIKITGIYSHFACADTPEAKENKEQLTTFQKLISKIPFNKVILHMANSAAALHIPESRFDMVRVGIALYGVDPAGIFKFNPVMRVKGKIVDIKTVYKGEYVGYGAKFKTEKTRKIALVPIGYADGLPWNIQSAYFLLNDKPVNPVGAISMDMVTIDITDISAKVGDEVVILGPDLSKKIRVETLARWAHTIPYEILCRFGARLPKVVVPAEVISEKVIEQK